MLLKNTLDQLISIDSFRLNPLESKDFTKEQINDNIYVQNAIKEGIIIIVEDNKDIVVKQQEKKRKKGAK